MKTRSKIGSRKGNPAYRTPSSFRYQKNIEVTAQKSRQINKHQQAEEHLAKKPI